MKKEVKVELKEKELDAEKKNKIAEWMSPKKDEKILKSEQRKQEKQMLENKMREAKEFSAKMAQRRHGVQQKKKEKYSEFLKHITTDEEGVLKDLELRTKEREDRRLAEAKRRADEYQKKKEHRSEELKKNLLGHVSSNKPLYKQIQEREKKEMFKELEERKKQLQKKRDFHKVTDEVIREHEEKYERIRLEKQDVRVKYRQDASLQHMEALEKIKALETNLTEKIKEDEKFYFEELAKKNEETKQRTEKKKAYSQIVKETIQPRPSKQKIMELALRMENLRTNPFKRKYNKNLSAMKDQRQQSYSNLQYFAHSNRTKSVEARSLDELNLNSQNALSNLSKLEASAVSSNTRIGGGPRSESESLDVKGGPRPPAYHSNMPNFKRKNNSQKNGKTNTSLNKVPFAMGDKKIVEEKEKKKVYQVNYLEQQRKLREDKGESPLHKNLDWKKEMKRNIEPEKKIENIKNKINRIDQEIMRKEQLLRVAKEQQVEGSIEKVDDMLVDSIKAKLAILNEYS